MKFSAALRLSDLPRLALVGAGGKSSALFWLAGELTAQGGKVLVTTTTHLATWQVTVGDRHLVVENDGDLRQVADIPAGIVVVTGPQTDPQRFGGLDGDTLSALHTLAGRHQLPLLIEADGARLLPLKAPAAHEPAIPAFVDSVVVCAGLQGLGKPLSAEYVHRPEQFAQLSGLGMGEPVTPAALSRLLMHSQGGLKGIPPNARRVLLLNQADTAEQQAQARTIAQQVQQGFHAVLITRLRDPKIFAVHEPVAGIVLAAGGATRFGSQKQLVDWQGQPMVRHVAQIALQAGLTPLVVVSGAGAQGVSQAVAGLPVRVVHNPAWQSGQSSSMHAGLNAIPPTGGGAVFLLADQPNVPAALIQALVEAHSQTLAPIVAPLVDGQRGNPVLFDPITYHDLMQVSGDVGGRQIFSKYPLQYVPWHDRAVLLDVDAPSDYEQSQLKKIR
jgi:molybdenum cofactor cytidylyltransferase